MNVPHESSPSRRAKRRDLEPRVGRRARARWVVDGDGVVAATMRTEALRVGIKPLDSRPRRSEARRFRGTSLDGGRPCGGRERVARVEARGGLDKASRGCEVRSRAGPREATSSRPSARRVSRECSARKDPRPGPRAERSHAYVAAARALPLAAAQSLRRGQSQSPGSSFAIAIESSIANASMGLGVGARGSRGRSRARRVVAVGRRDRRADARTTIVEAVA